METVESPLEVLSRAATMLQETEDASNLDETQKDDDLSRNSSVSKWKRDRRSRLPPEYSRKDQHQRRERRSTTPPENESRVSEAPIDMSVKQRGLPPSYAQAINNLGIRSTYRTPPPPPAPSSTVRDDIPAGISMCDPIIDEHFRRSLGNDYESLLVNNNSTKTQHQSKTSNCTSQANKTPSSLYESSSIRDIMDNTGVSVDDHFAKALGDTWYKLNNKNKDIKNDSKSEGHNMLSI